MTGISILIVDDDRLLVEKMKNTMDWEGLNISAVLTAYNIRQAEDVLNACPVQILLCDVDMPQGSGLELLAWIRSTGLKVECVFLSSYANFTYAQKALSLSACEYLLKPIANVDLERVLKRVVDSVREKRRSSGIQPEPPALDRNRLWEKLLLRQAPWDDMMQESATSRLFNPKEKFCMVFMCVLPSASRKPEKKESAILDFQIRDSVTDFFQNMEQKTGREELPETEWDSRRRELPETEKDSRREELSEKEQDSRRKELLEAVVHISEQEWILVMRCGEDWKTMKETIQNLVRYLRQQMDHPMAVCAGTPTPVENMSAGIEQLDALIASVVMDEDEIIFEDDWTMRKRTTAVPWKVWEKELLETGNVARTEERILYYIDEQRKSDGWNRNFLSCFLRELEQMMYFYLNEYGYSYTQLFDEQEFDKYERAAKTSVGKTKEFVLYIFEKLKGGRKAFTSQEDVVCRIKEYIESHLGENLSRSVLSQEVFLSEGYITQIFLKETGSSLPSYIAQRRIEKAKEYLEHSGLPVSRIASEVGYNNFSYFSKTFRELVGCTPNEYRTSIDKKRNRF
ncbi:MAG: response regulator [Clostridiales bacterium]|nr:response regulator [Clostridiales bacterium]